MWAVRAYQETWAQSNPPNLKNELKSVIQGMNTFKKIVPYLALVGFPFIALAQTVELWLLTVIPILNFVVQILLVIATAVFLWGVIQYLTAGADEERRASARSLMIYGLIALAVIIAVWGIVTVLVNTFAVNKVGIPNGVGAIF